MSATEIDFYRDVVEHYVREHDVPERDVAAALAVVLQGGTPLLVEAERSEQRPPSGGSRGGAEPARATYRISVGRRHKVEPRQIVGALANEGGLRRQDFGHIDIRGDHSLVELPADLPAHVWKKLRKTRISGKLIDLTPDEPARRKPRHKGKRR